MLRGGILSETDNPNTIDQPEMVGRVLYERFLVERDLTDQSIGSGFTSFAVKDLKNFCCDVTFKTLSSQMQAIVGGPTFRNVCEALSRLRHPNIEEVLETGLLFDGRPYAVTLLPAGRSLADVVREDGRLELTRIASIVEQLAEALAAVHSVKVLHCDVRPSNVIVAGDEGGIEKTHLINFGAAWPVDVRGATLENLQEGSESLSYAAPELHAKLGHRSTASDIFSLAALAYRLITGRVPFAGEDRVSLLRAINSGQIVPPSECRTDLGSEAENLLFSALQFEPAWRPQNAEDFGIRLARSLRPASRPAAQTIQIIPEPDVIAAGPDKHGREAAEAAAGRSEIRRVFKESKPAPPVSDRAVAWALIILLLAGALSIPIGQTLMAEERPGPAVSTMLPRPAEMAAKVQLRYWFEQQPGQDRTAAAERENSKLVLTASAAGELFVISETANAEGAAAYRFIQPAGTAGAVEPGKPVRMGAGAAEGELLWIVWTPAVQIDLAEIRGSVDAQGLVPEGEARKLRHFLERNRNLRVAISSDVLTGQTVLDGSGERLVHRIEPGQN